MKKRKENDIPMALIQGNAEPVRKRSKLVLPEPQISDQELEQVKPLVLLYITFISLFNLHNVKFYVKL